jgi:hypothetical protein
MSEQKKALLLVGSAKPEGQSTSESLGGYLLEGIAAHGWQTEKLLLHRSLRTPERTEALLAAVDAADLVILAFPLYVDTLPYLATRVLERIADSSPSPRRRGGRGERSFLAIVNCGFPEAEQCDTVLAICREFAAAAGMKWAGGLALGAGGAVNGRPLAQAGGMARNVVAALDQAAEALAAGEPIPPGVEALMREPMMPKRLYTLMGNMGWVLTARRHRTVRRLAARPLSEN